MNPNVRISICLQSINISHSEFCRIKSLQRNNAHITIVEETFCQHTNVIAKCCLYVVIHHPCAWQIV